METRNKNFFWNLTISVCEQKGCHILTTFYASQAQPIHAKQTISHAVYDSFEEHVWGLSNVPYFRMEGSVGGRGGGGSK